MSNGNVQPKPSTLDYVLAFNPFDLPLALYDAAHNAVASSTMGVIYQAAWGKIDPWTKEKMVADQAVALQQAGMNSDAAKAQASADVTSALQAAGADPEQIPEYWKTLGDLLTLAIIAGVVYLLAQVFIVGKAWKEVLSP